MVSTDVHVVAWCRQVIPKTSLTVLLQHSGVCTYTSVIIYRLSTYVLCIPSGVTQKGRVGLDISDLDAVLGCTLATKGTSCGQE